MMRRIIFLPALFFAINARAQQIEFKDSKQNFGFVHEGDTVRLVYEFKNTGDAPLIISNVEVECGCTVAEKEDKAIQPGESSRIKVSFDTHEKYDRQDRTFKVHSNAKNSPAELRFKGVVLKPKKK